MDRAEERRRRRRKGHIRLAAAIAVLVAVIVVIALLVRGCGGGTTDEQAGPQATATPDAAATAEATRSPKPVSTTPPLVGMGDTVRFQTPDGAVVRVTARDYEDPGATLAGVTPAAGERLVTLELSVTPEGAEGTAEIPLPFEKAASFILVAEDDTLTVAQLAGDDLLGATAAPGETFVTALAFSVGAAAPIRFVCTPVEGSLPRSATWELGE